MLIGMEVRVQESAQQVGEEGGGAVDPVVHEGASLPPGGEHAARRRGGFSE